MGTRFCPYPSTFGALVLSQIAGADVRPGVNRQVIVPSGAVDPAAVIVNSAEPLVSVPTGDLLTLLGSVSLSAGFNCTSGGTVRYQQRQDGSTFATGSSHVTVTATKGFLTCGSIGASQGQQAMADLTFWALYDGTNDALVKNTGVDFATAPSTAFNSAYWMGPAYLGSAQITGVVSTHVNTGIAYMVQVENGDIVGRRGAIILRQPTIEIVSDDLSYLSTINTMYLASIGSDPIKVYYALGAASSTRASYAASSHLKISAAAGAWGPTSVSARDNGDGSMTISVSVIGTLSTSLTSTIP